MGPTERKSDKTLMGGPAIAADEALDPGPMLDALPGAVKLIDAKGIIRYANAAMHELLGFEHGALIGQPLASIQAEMSQDDVVALAQRVIAGAHPHTALCSTYRTETGEVQEVQVNFRVITVDGAPHILSCVNPAEVQGPTLAAFEHRQWQLRLFSNLSSDYFYRSSMDAPGMPLEIWPLERFTHVTGYTREGVLEAGGWTAIVHPEDLERFTHPSRLRPEDGPQRFEYRIRAANGETRWLRDSIQVVTDPETHALLVFGAVTDVTGQHEALEALQGSEAQLRRIFDTVSQSFALLDRDLRVMAANKKMFHDFERGYERKLELGRSIVDQLPPEWAQVLTINAAATLAGEVRREELLWELPNGEPEWAAVQLNPIFEDGEVVGISACVEGIHRRKVAELALRESESQLRGIFDTVSQGFLLLDMDMTVTAANRKLLEDFEQSFGHHLKVGESILDVLPPDFQTLLTEHTQPVLAGERRVQEVKFPIIGAEPEWNEVQMNPIIEDGQVVGVSVCIDEIHRQKVAEDALHQAYAALEEKVAERTRELQVAYDQLRESEQRFSLIAERASDVIWHLDGQNSVLYMSPSFERVFGWSIQDLKERGIQICFRPEKRDEMTAALDDHLEHWRKLGKKPPTFTYEVEYQHRDGHAFFAEVNMDFDYPDFELWLKHGREEDYPHILGVSRDLTERKRQEAARQQLEQQVLHAQKLESLGVMAGGIAHDFNNLLVGIMGYASLAAMELAEDDPVLTYVSHIEAASQRAADLTQQMLAYSGRGQFVVQPVGVSELTREMAHLLGTVVSKKAVVEYYLADNLPTVRADATQIRQVVMNLITNASEALENEVGIVRLKTGLCALSARDLRSMLAAEKAEPGEFVFIEVTDTGCGMDHETLARIFDPFYTTKFTGRGLGLGAVHGIVRGHNGAVHVTSAVGRGTTIRVCLPVSGEPLPEQDDSAPTRDAQGRGETILVVDDEESVREFARNALELGGYRVRMANNGREAIEFMEREGDSVQGILLDLTMPEMGGAEALEILKERWPEVSIVLSSGHAEKQALEDTGGVVPFLHKPYHPDLLRRFMRQAIGQTVRALEKQAEEKHGNNG